MLNAASSSNGFAPRILSGSSSTLNPGRLFTNRARSAIGRTIEMIVRGWRRRRVSES